MTNNAFFKKGSPMTKWQKTTTHTSAHKAANFNALHKPGTLVKVRDGINAHIITRTKGEAFTVSGQFSCIQVKFQNRFFLLQETQVLPETSTDKETPES
jgi:hypothetical protein